MADKPGVPDHARRCSELLSEPQFDAVLITGLHNVRYLTGFTGSNGALLLSASGAGTLFTDPRYTVQAGRQTNCSVVVTKGPLIRAVAAKVGRARYRTLGFEQDHMLLGQFELLRRELPSTCQAIALNSFVERARMVKDAAEIDLIRQSVRTNSRALESALARLKPGMTEARFAAEIDYRNRILGAEAPAFDTIVASGERAALPHAHPGDTRIGPGMLLVDMGAFRQGYASDMTRMVWLGKAPARYRKAYRAVLEAQAAAIDVVKAGVRAAAVDRAARAVLKTHGLEREFVHSTGHGLGLEIHEPPRIGRKATDLLQAGMAITIEPGVYIEGWGGIRIEDTILVTENGCEILTPTSKDLREIDLREI